MKKISVIIPVYNQEVLILKALDSIPKNDDIEIIVINDCSTDNTLNVLYEYQQNRDIIILNNETNRGVGYTVNRGYDIAQGEYIVLLGSDDYFITEEFNKIYPYLNGTDLVYFNLRINDLTVWRVNEVSSRGYVGSVKFMRREFIGNIRCPDKRQAEDFDFFQELLKKNPTEFFTDLTIKHYNFPREGSLYWNMTHKEG